jgi:serine/threonine protein kinase
MALDGRYTLLGDRLAKGSYGEVWVAWDEQTSKVVAIKRQRSDSSTAGRELNAYHSLPNHPNVLALLHTFVALGAANKEGRTLNLVFPYHNSSLFAVWRAARGRLDLCEVRRYCSHICQGLDHLHRHNICHRD